ncbi:hypothetical protein IWZ01DRAFT_480023 [Phyllosticta capitalensis]
MGKSNTGGDGQPSKSSANARKSRAGPSASSSRVYKFSSLWANKCLRCGSHVHGDWNHCRRPCYFCAREDHIGSGCPQQSASFYKIKRAVPPISPQDMRRLECACEQANAGVLTSDEDDGGDDDGRPHTNGSDTSDEADIPSTPSSQSSGSTSSMHLLDVQTAQCMADENERLSTALGRTYAEINDLKNRLSVAEHSPNSREVHLANDNADLQQRLEVKENGCQIAERRNRELQARIERMNAELLEAQRQKHSAEERLNSEFVNWQAHRANLESENRSLRSHHHQTLEVYNRMLQRMRELDNECHRQKEEIAMLQNASVVAENANLQRSLRTAQDSLTESGAEQERLGRQNADLQQRLRTADEKNFEIRKRAWRAEDTLATEVAERKEMEKKHKRDLANMEKESDRFLAEATKVEAENMKLRAILKKRDEELEELRSMKARGVKRQTTLSFAVEPSRASKSMRSTPSSGVEIKAEQE